MTPVLVLLAARRGRRAPSSPVSAREPRLAALGTLVALLGSAYVADPLPGTLALAARLVGAVLGGYLVWVALRRAPAPTAGSHLGWPGAAAIAIVGVRRRLAHGRGARRRARRDLRRGPADRALPRRGARRRVAVSRAALGAAFALVALAAGPVLLARDVLRLGLGPAADARRGGAAAARPCPGVPTTRSQLAFALLFAAGGAAVAGLVAAVAPDPWRPRPAGARVARGRRPAPAPRTRRTRRRKHR